MQRPGMGYENINQLSMPQDTGSWWDIDWLNKLDPKTGMVQQGAMGGVMAGAGAITNAYLGYQGLQEARKSREMQEKYAAVDLQNKGTAYNANVRDTAANNAAINNWSNDQRDQYIAGNQARTTL